MTSPTPSGQVPAAVTAAVVAAFKAPWTSREHVPGTRNPREYVETVHVPSGADATMVVSTASDGHPSIRALTFDEVLAAAYPIIVAHLSASPDRVADQTITAGAATHRPGIEHLLADLADHAANPAATPDAEPDPALGFTVEALRAVHALYPGADTISAAGTWQAQARTDIHNAIVAAAVHHLDHTDPVTPSPSTGQTPDAASGSVPSPRTWTVEVYEPAATPNGFWGTYTVTAPTTDQAADAAVRAAEAAWGPTSGLAVLAVEPAEPDAA